MTRIDPGQARELARAWLEVDPDDDTRDELTSLLDDDAALTARFSGRLQFGTAGLRGPLGAGPTRMNRVLVRATAAAIARTLNARGQTDGPVVIAYDARHKSDVFAADSARAFAGAGLAVELLPGPTATPVLAYAVRRRTAVAGVMVTASHNPPADNGYKVYWGDGAQIIPPIDREISTAIDDIGLPDESLLAAIDDRLISRLDASIVEDYLSAITAARVSSGSPSVPLTIAYTALHGVGGELVEHALARAGHPAPIVVAAQHQPDPDFPTVDFPNPEDDGAMDLLLALAEDVGADLALANDPDADRLAAAVPTAEGWRVLNGNELGWVLAEYLLTHGDTTAGRRVSTSIVSSGLLTDIADHHGASSTRTLTGFKWIVRPALDDANSRLVFAYEEALGYLVNDVVMDKDGISAAVAMADLVAGLRADGRSVENLLDELARRHGVRVSDGWSIRLDGADPAARRDDIMSELRSKPPVTLAGQAVVSIDDLATGDPPADVVVIAADTVRVTVRPSGTEPKVKIYVEVRVAADDGDVDAARRTAADLIERLRSEPTLSA